MLRLVYVHDEPVLLGNGVSLRELALPGVLYLHTRRVVRRGCRSVKEIE